MEADAMAICPRCGSPIPDCLIPSPTGYVEVPAKPCSEEMPYHATPEHSVEWGDHRWDWYGDDKPPREEGAK